MTQSNLIFWESRITTAALILLGFATAFGIAVGAFISMYYDAVPNMDLIEDKLSPLQGIPYLIAILISLIHIPLALFNAKNGEWAQAAIRAVTVAAPLIIALGTDGLIAHFMWWGPLSSTGRFHMLHHTITTGVPLTLGYWLFLRRWWKPDQLNAPETVLSGAWIVTGLVGVLILLGIGILIGLIDPITAGITMVVGIIAGVALWFFMRKRRAAVSAGPAE